MQNLGMLENTLNSLFHQMGSSFLNFVLPVTFLLLLPFPSISRCVIFLLLTHMKKSLCNDQC